jgi:hypothetical protein
MWRALRIAWAGLMAALCTGCYSLGVGPLVENPVYVRPDPTTTVENPVYVPQGPWAYNVVFEKIIDILDDYFEIASTNRYAGEIQTFPRVAPGFEQFWRPGNPDCYDRLLATFQTIRNRGFVRIEPAKDGGYFIDVVVYKELEDMPRPIRQTAGSASFRDMPTVERQFEVIDPTVFDTGWIPLGRNSPLEQLILQRIKGCL